jgi:hypothetical protein
MVQGHRLEGVSEGPEVAGWPGLAVRRADQQLYLYAVKLPRAPHNGLAIMCPQLPFAAPHELR